jgi:hypothetical protein
MKLHNLTDPKEREDHIKIHAWACEKHDQTGCTYSGYP